MVNEATIGSGTEIKRTPTRLRAPFPNKAKRNQRCREHAEPNRQPDAANEVGGVGAEQAELSAREVEDARHDAESQHHEEHDGAETRDLEGGVQWAFDAVLPAGGLRWPGPLVVVSKARWPRISFPAPPRVW
jgi:hypothetical protein